MSSITQSARMAAAAIVAVLMLGATAQAATPQQKCRSTIIKEAGKFQAAKTKALQKCEEAIVKGKTGYSSPSGSRCTDVGGKTDATIAKAETKFRGKVDKACGGADKVCGTGNDDLSLFSIGWQIGTCPNFEKQECSMQILNCGDIATCLACMNEAAIDQAIDLYYNDLTPAQFGTSSDINKCQAAIGKETAKFLLAKSKTLAKCEDAVNQGKPGFAIPCPAGDASGKTAASIANAEAKKVAKLCKACGGPDQTCGTGDDLDPQTDIGFVDNCPLVQVPGGEDCGAIGAIDTLSKMVDCLDCVTEFKVDCMDSATVGNATPYPSQCNVCLPRTGACPTKLRFKSDGGFTADLDSGWTGIAHDNEVPSNGSLTLAISSCANPTTPCGQCNTTGPITNAGGAASNNHRCATASWVQCTTAADCPGAEPCIFYFGAPLPLSSGNVPVCVTNRINGPVNGTVNVDDGNASTVINLLSRVNTGGLVDKPCPRCVNGKCDAGPRATQPCTVMGVSPQFGSVSLDCPAEPGADAANLQIRLPTATGLQSVSLSGSSPTCSASGKGAFKCFCDTCNNLNAEPCMADTDCPDNPTGTPGICGGSRCIGGIDAGAPCVLPTDCSEFSCGTMGEPTAPNACSGGATPMCVANPADTGSVNEGRCDSAPNDQRCSLETFRQCILTSDCIPDTTPGGTCQGCVPGQTCVVKRRECYTDNGQIGGTVSVGGSPGVPCGNVSHPKLGALFCIGDTGGPAVNATGGLPGLGRLTLPGTVRLD